MSLLEITLPEDPKKEKTFKDYIGAMEQFYAGMLSLSGSQTNHDKKYYTLEIALPGDGTDIRFYAGVPNKSVYGTSSTVSLTASLSGFTATSFSVSPALPSGFTLNTTTGAITGTVSTTTQNATNYTVTATSSSGSTIATTLTIQIVNAIFICNTSGIATGCGAAQPFSCSASNSCYASYTGCTSATSCGY
jgi:hypothetical protein